VYNGKFVVSDDGFCDFGECRQSHELVHTFTLTNMSSLPVKILGIESSCGCTWIDVKGGVLAGKIISADKEFKLPVRFNTGVHQGNISGTIAIMYCHLDKAGKSRFNGGIVLKVAGTVRPEYQLKPIEIDFGEIDGFCTKKVEAEIVITPVVFAELMVNSVRTSGEMFKAILHPQSDGTGFVLHVELDLSFYNKTQSINGYVVVETNSEVVPSAIVPVKSKYISPVELYPDSVVIGTNECGEVLEEVHITSSRVSKIISINLEESKYIRAEYSKDKAKEHLLQLFVSEPKKKDIEEKIQINLELYTDKGDVIPLSLYLPVYRLTKGD
jgi:hypothetical protein